MKAGRTGRAGIKEGKQSKHGASSVGAYVYEQISLTRLDILPRRVSDVFVIAAHEATRLHVGNVMAFCHRGSDVLHYEGEFVASRAEMQHARKCDEVATFPADVVKALEMEKQGLSTGLHANVLLDDVATLLTHVLGAGLQVELPHVVSVVGNV